MKSSCNFYDTCLCSFQFQLSICALGIVSTSLKHSEVSAYNGYVVFGAYANQVTQEFGLISLFIIWLMDCWGGKVMSSVVAEDCMDGNEKRLLPTGLIKPIRAAPDRL